MPTISDADPSGRGGKSDGQDSADVYELGGRRYERVSTVQRIDLGEVVFDPATGIGTRKSFEVLPGAVGFSVLIHKGEGAHYAYVYRLVDPLGQELISPKPKGVPEEVASKAVRGQAASSNGIQPGAFTQMSVTPVPVNTSVKVVPGVWELEVALETPLSASSVLQRHVEVVAKHVDESVAIDELVGIVPVAVAATEGVASRGAMLFDDGFLNMRAMYEEEGLVFDLFEEPNLDDAYAAQRGYDPASGGPNDTFVDLMNYPVEAATIRAFFVPERNENTYAGVATFSGADAMLSGRGPVFGGVVVSDDRFPEVTFAHELGHHLGLYHTNTDQLGDTLSSNHQLYGDELFAQGASYEASKNLMQDGGGDFLISAEQAWVIRRRPFVTLYRPIE